MTKRGDSRDVLTFSVDGEECVPITQAAELRKVSRAATWTSGGGGESRNVNGEGPVIFFVPGKTWNLLNASGLHWRMRQRYHKEWRAEGEEIAVTSRAAFPHGAAGGPLP